MSEALNIHCMSIIETFICYGDFIPNFRHRYGHSSELKQVLHISNNIGFLLIMLDIQCIYYSSYTCSLVLSALFLLQNCFYSRFSRKNSKYLDVKTRIKSRHKGNLRTFYWNSSLPLEKSWVSCLSYTPSVASSCWTRYATGDLASEFAPVAHHHH